MKTLKSWLKEKQGRSASLALDLAVGRSALSQVASGLRGIPVSWMPIIEKHTNGEVTVLDMVKARSKGKLPIRKARRKTAMVP